MVILVAIIALVTAFIPLQPAQAVPSPDFIFNIGAQVAQVFSFIAVASALVVGSLRRWLESQPFVARLGKVAGILVVLLILGISAGGAYVYRTHKQQQAYEAWLAHSGAQSQPAGQEVTATPDKLKIGDERGDEDAPELANDAGAIFIRRYYENLASGNTAAAYAVSSKTVSYDVYASWYRATETIHIDSLQKISDTKYSLGLTLVEPSGSTRYAVLMTLAGDQANLSVAHSEVRVLAGDVSSSSTFFEENKTLPLAIRNAEFGQTIVSGDVVVLDAREDEEYRIGRFPGSRHIRFADLLAGEWVSLPQDQVVYVFCWSGIRGKEVAEFLRSKNIVARYVEAGADGWVKDGGRWEGGIAFSSAYGEERYRIILSTAQVKEEQRRGAVLVDSRHPAVATRDPIAGSVLVPILYTPSSKLDEVLGQVPAGASVVTMCSDFVSCFDAKVAGIKLEQRGHRFIGRYNTPWEYRP